LAFGAPARAEDVLDALEQEVAGRDAHGHLACAAQEAAEAAVGRPRARLHRRAAGSGPRRRRLGRRLRRRLRQERARLPGQLGLSRVQSLVGQDRVLHEEVDGVGVGAHGLGDHGVGFGVLVGLRRAGDVGQEAGQDAAFVGRHGEVSITSAAPS
jgi:hypothetical protein